MKKCILLSLFALWYISGNTQNQLNNFSELMEALMNGKHVSVVLHYGKCQLISDNEISDKSPNAIGGMHIEVYEYFEKGAVYNDKAFLVFSESKLIQNPIGAGFVYNYAKIKASEDGNVKITAKYLDPDTLEENMSENFFTIINDGKNEGAVYFYARE
jgi:hypothetical protein